MKAFFRRIGGASLFWFVDWAREEKKNVEEKKGGLAEPRNGGGTQPVL